MKKCFYRNGTTGFPEIEGEFIRFQGTSVVVKRFKDVTLQDFTSGKVTTTQVQVTEFWPRSKVTFREV